MKAACDYDQQKNALQSKIQYLQNKVQRGKDDYEDLLHKFDAAVKSLSQNPKNQLEYQDKYYKLKEQYNKKLKQKEEAMDQ